MHMILLRGVTNVIAVKKRKKTMINIKSSRAIAGLVLSLPCIVGVIWLFIIPMGLSLKMSLSNVLIAPGGLVYKFTQFDNYFNAMFSDPNFNRNLVDSIFQLVNVPIILIFSFFAAMIINQKFVGQRIARVIFFLPIVLSSAAMQSLNSTDILQQTMQSEGFKSLSTATNSFQNIQLDLLFIQFGLPNSFVVFLSGATKQVIQLVAISGVQMIVFLASLQSVPPSLYEAAYIEGASGWEKFWVVTLPMISPTILLCLVYSIIDSFTSNDNKVLTLINSQLTSMNYGLGSAMAWIYFLVITILLVIILVIGNRLVFSYDK